MLLSIMSSMNKFFIYVIPTSHNSLLRCMGHIINLAQQAFICAFMGGMGNLEEPVVDLSGLEESFVRVLIGPLLAYV